jgi:YfiH family protein
MPFRQMGSLRFYQFESLVHPRLVHAIFTRQGGVSPEPWRSLNVGGNVGDERGRVLENLRRACAVVGRDPHSIYDVWQVHSARVVRADAPRSGRELIQADVLITDDPSVTLFMRFADCVPIFLHDPKRSAIGLVHAGWLGTVRAAPVAAVRAMAEAFGTHPEDLRVGIGPAIGPDHYPVGPEVVEKVRETFGSSAGNHLQTHDGEVYLNLWSANRFLLEQEGVKSIEIAEQCTACHLDEWYSHRGEGRVTGRFGALIALDA